MKKYLKLNKFKVEAIKIEKNWKTEFILFQIRAFKNKQFYIQVNQNLTDLKRSTENCSTI